ncbi:hypothetical protein GGTG_03691 [Gaeumannomyces tritici R3-111a-1]|uniref:Lid2 complex component snt2 n=1 Tax=Gaeumannomyces tritici (strain R3-111a-1) TaxID=644352 RepID=J3NQY6_GAET3|nr:hypothetical protein GGTG_03691 [Gaeumannomyces tritici R3-111a-1]EJT78592.1 hypothetical protein GGTG_03691 [Gaeumannomyces tritici R3-111a-1]
MAQKPQGSGASDGQAASARGTADAAPSSKQSNSAHSSVLPRMSDPGPSHGHASEPMVKSNSSSSNPASSKDAAGSTASPYGTRSRNRNGSSRPNYAEDKDIDMEIFELYPGRADDDAKKPPRPVASTTPSNNGMPATSTAATAPAASAAAAVNDAPPRAPGGSSRKPLPSDSKHSQNGAKDQSSNSHLTASAAAAAAPAQSSSKKRKAASQASQSSHAVAADSPSTAVVIKRSGNASNAPSSAAASQGYATTNLLTFEACGNTPKDGKMIADDGTELAVNDHVYLVCEPPGEPYYLARIMEFLHVKNDPSQPVDALRVNWYYRPKDIARKANDTRAVFATMHSDVSPLTSLRGKCVIKHKAEIAKLEEYRKIPDYFWFEKLYDRYIQKNYEVIPTFQIINVPEKVKKVLDDRWKYILVEQGRGKELTSAVKLCKRCSGYCASNDSVDCAVCQNTYHMNCVRPPLLKKPSRGFAWSCAACSRAQERKLEARNTPNVGLDSNAEPDDEELYDEEEDDLAAADTGRTSPADGHNEPHAPVSAEQMYHASLWPYRYLGIHCKVEDVLDYDDRIYPRASTRIGPRHQATVPDWPGRPVEYVKPTEVEVRKSGRKDGRLSKEAQAALEAEKIAKSKRPKWVQDEPAGYVARGEDYENEDPRNTAQLLWKPLEAEASDLPENAIEVYMSRVREMNKTTLRLPHESTNLLDAARDVLYAHDYDFKEALIELPLMDKEAFREPELSPAEVKRFEEGVAKFGSELHSVKKHVKTVSPGDIVRFYYTWKKSKRGKDIWGNYSGRKSKKEIKEAKKTEAASQSKMQDDVADDHDDSAFDAEKARDKKRQFICKFCNTKQSRQWRRAPNASGALVSENGGKGAGKDKGNQYVIALCRRCAELWRRYAIQWEDVDQLVSKVAQAGGRAWKKKIDEEVLKEIVAAEQRSKHTSYNSGAETPPTSTAAASKQSSPAAQEPPKKKLKIVAAEKEVEQTGSESGSIPGAVAAPHTKKKDKGADKEKDKAADKDKLAPAPPVPDMPKARTMPCAVCRQVEPLGDQHLTCKECRVAVHRNCYGVIDNRNPGKWVCDMCANDRSPHVSIHYKCVLCPVEHTEHDFVGPPKISHKKRTEKDRERERVERENAVKAAQFYQKRQEELNRPANPREPLKRTADNNWVHVTCAVWTPEVKFGNAKALEPSEGIPSIPRSRYNEVCKACKNTGGACVSCSQCRAQVHVECAHQSGFLLGFDISPIKGSRRDQHNIVTINGETGVMSATIWCKEHIPQKTIVHQMFDMVDDTGMNALQLYVQNSKRADLTLTGCARKANLITNAARMSNPTPTTASAVLSSNRRASTTAMAPLSVSTHTHSVANGGGVAQDAGGLLTPGGKVCMTCGVDVSPRWYPIDKAQERELTNGHHGNLGEEAQKFVDQRTFQCHKCKKLEKQPVSHAQAQIKAEAVSSEQLSARNNAHTAMAPMAAGPIVAPVALERGPPPGPPPPPGHCEPVDPLPRATPPLTSPRAPGLEQTQPRLGAYGWPTPLQPPHQVGIVQPPGSMQAHAPAPAPPMQTHPLQPPSIAPPPLPHGMPGRVAPPVGQPPGPGPVAPPSAHHYQQPPPAPAPSTYTDWHRTTHRPSSIQQPVNGGPSHPGISQVSASPISSLIPPTLRPPPISHPPAGPHAGPLMNGHMAQPHAMVNGIPQSRRLSGPPPPPPPAGPGPYMQSYHHPTHHTPHMTNGMAPPRIDHGHAFSQMLTPHRAPYPSHGSPPVSREPPPPPTGASTNPSLRNLLS